MMSSFIISENNQKNYKFNIQCKETNIPENPDERFGYDPRLNEYRNFIDNIKSEDWKKVRWYINEYDFLVKDPIINRAFYKYWEIINEFEIFENYQDKNLILHCAEAPGGFIQGTNIYLQIDRIQENEESMKNNIDEHGWVTIKKKQKKQKRDYRIFTISLNKDLPQYKCYNLPSYNKNIINKHVCITYGKDNTGDLNNWDNIKYIQALANNKHFFLITADGGFDEGTDFNNKEQLHYYLILSEIYTAISLQKTDGHFILKVFDMFTEPSIHLLYLLSIAYKNISIYKPKTSRPTNSEKYIICKNFNLNSTEKQAILEQLELLYAKMSRLTSKYVVFTLFDKVPEDFITKVHNMNQELLKKQCTFLQKAVDLCKDQTFLTNYEINLDKSIEKRRDYFYEWEQYYNLNSYV